MLARATWRACALEMPWSFVTIPSASSCGLIWRLSRGGLGRKMNGGLCRLASIRLTSGV